MWSGACSNSPKTGHAGGGFKHPLNSELRGSGAIKQHADGVMFVHWDEYCLERSDKEVRPSTSNR